MLGGITAEISYETSAVTFLDDTLAPLITLKGLLGKAGFSPVYAYGKNFRIETSDPAGVRVTAIIDSQGQLINPLIPLSETQMFLTASAGAAGGFIEHFLLGVATDSGRTHFYPLSPDGHLPADPLPFKGYLPAPALSPTEVGKIEPTRPFYVTRAACTPPPVAPGGCTSTASGNRRSDISCPPPVRGDVSQP